MERETLTKTVKKVIRWGKGYSVFITREAKMLKWDDKTYVTVSVSKDGDREEIIIRKAIIK